MLQASLLFCNPFEGYPQHVHISQIRVLRLSIKQVWGESPGPESQVIISEQLKRELLTFLTGGSNLGSVKSRPTLAPDQDHINYFYLKRLYGSYLGVGYTILGPIKQNSLLHRNQVLPMVPWIKTTGVCPGVFVKSGISSRYVSFGASK